MYKSTRGKIEVNASTAIVRGLAEDGGLYVPVQMPSIDFNNEWLNYSYKDIAFIIFKAFLDDFSDDEIKDVIDKAYNKNNFKDKIVGLEYKDNFAFLTLYHGPTFAFKDMALTVLPLLMEKALVKVNNAKKTYILTATSGDTGSAAMSGFSGTNDIKTIVLYPNNGVSALQEKQMHSFAKDGSCALAVEGNFDDCQRIAKDMFNTYKSDFINLASANSINIGRLIPQIVYYFYAYLESIKNNKIKFGDLINITVPTGNFGNILAAYFAKELGLPVNKLICASNKNNVLTDFFKTGIYDKNRPFYKTISPSMDILVSSNLERYLYLISNGNDELITKLMNELNTSGKYSLPQDIFAKTNEFIGGYADEKDTLEAIEDAYHHEHFLIDPHTAVAYSVYKKVAPKEYFTVIASTASPFKFPQAYESIFNIRNKDIFKEINELSKVTGFLMDDRMKALESVTVNKHVVLINNAKQEIKKILGE